MPSNGRRRRRPCRGGVAKKYFQTTIPWDENAQFIRRREFRFAYNFVDGLVRILPALGDISQKRLSKVLTALAKDSITLSGYRIRGEKDLTKQAAYLVNMPRVQQEIERHMGLKGLGMDKIAKTLAGIMNGEVTVTTTTTCSDGKVTTVKQEPSIGDRLRAIDLRIRATTGYAATNARVAVGVTNVGALYDASEFESTPAIAVDPTIALSAEKEVIEHEPMFEDEHPDDCECDDCGEWEEDEEDDDA